MADKLKILTVNLGNFGSTGSIARAVAGHAAASGHTTRHAYPNTLRSRPNDDDDIIICSATGNRINQRIARLTGRIGGHAKSATRRLIGRIKAYSPDIIHLHNLHSSYINLRLLFGYLKDSGIPVVWTLHDCWAFTGKCPHFLYVGCDGWTHGCGDCPQLSEYPRIDRDTTAELYKEKRELFSSLPNLTLVTPSKWLADTVARSFLSDTDTRVIHNGIDTHAFSPRESDLRKRLGIGDRPLLLGVSFDWSHRKGLDVFARLAEAAPDCTVVLVGTDATTPELPENVIKLPRTASREDLARLYSAADLFVNPTREDTFPTVNLEALACGCPVLTFATGGAAEALTPLTGCAVETGDVDALTAQVRRIIDTRPFDPAACRARGAEFSEAARLSEYVSLYEEIASKSKNK